MDQQDNHWSYRMILIGGGVAVLLHIFTLAWNGAFLIAYPHGGERVERLRLLCSVAYLLGTGAFALGAGRSPDIQVRKLLRRVARVQMVATLGIGLIYVLQTQTYTYFVGGYFGKASVLIVLFGVIATPVLPLAGFWGICHGLGGLFLFALTLVLLRWLAGEWACRTKGTTAMPK